MKFFKKILLAIILLPCAFMFTACLNAEPNIYLVDVVFDDSGEDIVCTYIYSNGYKKTKTIKNQGNMPKTIIDISKKLGETNVFEITYSDNTTTEISIDKDSLNPITKFEKKSGLNNTYIITYADGTNNEITIDSDDVAGIVDITKTPGNSGSYTITYSDGTTKQIAIENDNINSIIGFEPKPGYKFVYVITYEDGTTSEITIDTDDTISVVGITKTPGNNNNYTIMYSDNSTSQITLTADNVNSIVNFEKKTGSDSIYIITFEDGTTEEITITGQNTSNEYYETKVIETYNKIVNSAVIIQASQSANENLISCGSGVIYSMDKSSGGKTYIITNHHVIEDENLADKISQEIYIFPFGAKYGLTATCIGASESIDVAILMVDTQALLELNEYCYAPAIAEDRVLGDTAIAVGNPENQGMTITSGRVSLEYKYIGVEDSSYDRVVFGLDTPINSGNSGGGIFNLNGELIGIADAKMIEFIDTENNSTDNLDNMGYALPIELVEALAENILDQYNTNPTYTQAKKIKLGITIEVIDSHAVKDANGITKTTTDVSIKSISTTDLAYTKFGLRQNDILNEIIINGTSYPVNYIFDFDTYLLYVRAGDTVKFKYTRGDVTYTSTTYTIKASDISVIVE